MWAAVGCFNPPEPSATADTDTDAMDDADASSGMNPTTADGSNTNPVTTDTPPTTSTTDPDPTTGPGDPVCGDGEVEGDEVCDDGVNDASYGGCLEDCSGLAEHCGDGELNGPEACDDGVNDGAYDGCAVGCAELGPHCGDGEVQNMHEACDDGPANENGAGCNVDCVTSGTVVATWRSDSIGTCGGIATNPVVRANGNVLVAAEGYCSEVVTAGYELSPDLELEDEYNFIISEFPWRAALRGDDWLLASYGCNFVVDDTGSVDEICEDRITGVDGLYAIDDTEYIAIRNEQLGRFGGGSPALGDSPDWSVEPPPDGVSWIYRAYYAAAGTLGSSVIAGYYRTGSTSPYTYYAYIQLFSAGGNSVDSRTYSQFDNIYQIEADPNGGFVVRGYDDVTTDNLMRVNANLNYDWSMDACDYISRFAVDSVGDIILECDEAWPNRDIIKLDSAGNERWRFSLEFGFDPTFGELGIDENDYIYRTSVEFDFDTGASNLVVEKISP